MLHFLGRISILGDKSKWSATNDGRTQHQEFIFNLHFSDLNTTYNMQDVRERKRKRVVRSCRECLRRKQKVSYSFDISELLCSLENEFWTTSTNSLFPVWPWSAMLELCGEKGGGILCLWWARKVSYDFSFYYARSPIVEELFVGWNIYRQGLQYREALIRPSKMSAGS